MTIDLKKARDFVYANGTLWERALFAYHFQDGQLARLHKTLLQYKNPDGGYGHALEHDVRCPQSHPAAVEFLLGVITWHELPVGNLLVDTPEWVIQHQNEDGSLQNPPELLDYPHAPWWAQMGGQQAPDAIAGRLNRLGLASPGLLERTQAWAQRHLTPDAIRKVDWLFMNYHAHDYFFNIESYPDLEAHRQATVETIIATAREAPEAQYPVIFNFCSQPDAPVTQALPADLVNQALDYLVENQQADGGWHDEHGLAQWWPYTTITSLVVLHRFGRLKQAQLPL